MLLKMKSTTANLMLPASAMPCARRQGTFASRESCQSSRWPATSVFPRMPWASISSLCARKLLAIVLLDADARGVDVRVIADLGCAQHPSSTVMDLQMAEVPVHRIHMHHTRSKWS